jgi:hypothetical protein
VLELALRNLFDKLVIVLESSVAISTALRSRWARSPSRRFLPPRNIGDFESTIANGMIDQYDNC